MKHCVGCILSLGFLATVMTLPIGEAEGDADEVEYIIEDDMHIPVMSQRRLQRGMVLNWKWPNGTVPFVVDPNFSDAERLVIAIGLAEFPKYSCVQFVPRTTEKTYVNISMGTSCWAVLGYHEGAGLRLSLHSSCLGHRTFVHEAMHALGFVHEQNREDRDYSVIILLDNVDANRNDMMKTYDAVSLGVPYNVESAMHYSASGLSVNGKTTILSTRAHHPIDDKKIPWSDFRKVNRLYNCPSSYEAALDRLEYGD